MYTCGAVPELGIRSMGSVSLVMLPSNKRSPTRAKKGSTNLLSSDMDSAINLFAVPIRTDKFSTPLLPDSSTCKPGEVFSDL